MSNFGLYDEIVRSLQSSALDPSSWSRAYQLIDEAVGVHGSTTAFAAGEKSSDVRIFLFWCYDGGIRQQELEQRYLDDYYMDDERIPRIRRMPVNKLVHIKDLYTESELKTSVAYNEAMAICRGQDSLHIRLPGPDDSRITWVPNDPRDDEGWSSEKIKLIHNVIPHLNHAIRVQHSVSGAGILNATLTDLLDARGLATIQLDERGRIHDLNDRGKSLLREGNTLYDRKGYLLARPSRNNQMLQKLITRAIPSRGSVGRGGTAIFARWPKPPLLLQAHPVQTPAEEPRTWRTSTLILISDLPVRPNIDPKSAAQILNLTEMESRIAVMLTSGMTVSSIAKELKRKESTIRHHVKRMFVKHNLTRQTELIDLVRSIAGAPKT